MSRSRSYHAAEGPRPEAAQSLPAPRAVYTDAMYELAAEVSTKHDLQRFLEELADDYLAHGEIWLNHSIPDFLRAFACCLQRSERAAASGEFAQGAQFATWQFIARLLLASSVERHARRDTGHRSQPCSEAGQGKAVARCGGTPAAFDARTASAG